MKNGSNLETMYHKLIINVLNAIPLSNQFPRNPKIIIMKTFNAAKNVELLIHYKTP